MTVDFSAIKAELTTDEAIQKVMDQVEKKDNFDDTKRLIVNLVDLIEYTYLAFPCLRIVGWLCEQANHSVLATSLENAEIAGVMETLVSGAWLADINSKKGQGVLIQASKDLPLAPFLRITLATHYISRVYWNQWLQDDRMRLLEVAVEVLKPLSLGVDKASFKRLIERGLEKDPKEDDTSEVA